MALLGPVPQDGTIANKLTIAVAVEQALSWIRKVRAEGKDWQLLPAPSEPGLYPNMSGADDDGMMVEITPAELEPGIEADQPASRWIGVKKWLAGELKELTLLWRVGASGRERAHDAGIYRWDDPRITPERVGVGGPKYGPTLA